MKPFFNLEDLLKEKTNNIIDINFKVFDSSIPAFYRDNSGNAGFDLFARIDNEIQVKPGEVVTIPLNVATEIPYNVVGLVFQRSSTFRKWGLRLTNGVGVIDASYRGDGDEWLAEFQNMTDKVITIKRGDKLCQALFLPLIQVNLIEKFSLGNKNRGGFGTTGSNAKELRRVNSEDNSY